MSRNITGDPGRLVGHTLNQRLTMTKDLSVELHYKDDRVLPEAL